MKGERRPAGAAPRMLPGLALVVAGAVAFALGPGPARLQALLCWLVLLATHLALAARSLAVASAAPAGSPVRRVWSGLVLAGSAFAVGDVVQLVAMAVRPDRTNVLGTPVQTLLLAAGLAGLVLVVLLEPVRLGSRRQRVRYWLDVAVVMTATVPLVVRAVDLNSRSDIPLAVALCTGPLLYLVGIFAVVKLALSPAPPFRPLAGLMLAVAAAVEALLAGLDRALGEPERLPWLFGLQVLANGLLALTPWAQVDRTGPAGAARARRYSVLPYLAVGATELLLVLSLAGRDLGPQIWSVVAAAVLCTVLVVVRQLDAFVETDRLVAELDVRVAELNEALAERDLLAGRLHHQAFHDPLTGLPNRALLLHRLSRQAGPEPASSPVALLLVDLDGFKPVNDAHGHETGDRLLVAVAQRLSGCVRDGDLVARLGGDEFAVLVHGDEPAEALAERMVQRFRLPFSLGDRGAGGVTVTVTASIGLAYPDPEAGLDADLLLREADLAMYAAKRAGKGRYQVAVRQP